MFIHKFITWIVLLCKIWHIVGRRFPMGMDSSMGSNAGVTTQGRTNVLCLDKFQRSMSYQSASQRSVQTNPIFGYIRAPRRIRYPRQWNNARSVLAHMKCSEKATTYPKASTSLFDASEDRSENIDPKPAGWNGEVVANSKDGRIRGCSIQPLNDSNSEDTPNTEWIITIDGVEADLGRFGEAIYKKFIQDAKQQRFQGFRPGTIPPHLEPTYRTFAMDECARETILEAMQQNDIRPFENCRSEIYLYDFCIPPPISSKSNSKSKKTKKTSRKNQTTGAAMDETAATKSNSDDTQSVEPSWRTFATMKEAIDAGWRPGQSFSYSAKNVRGQKVKVGTPLGSTSIGANY